MDNTTHKFPSLVILLHYIFHLSHHHLYSSLGYYSLYHSVLHYENPYHKYLSQLFQLFNWYFSLIFICFSWFIFHFSWNFMYFLFYIIIAFSWIMSITFHKVLIRWYNFSIIFFFVFFNLFVAISNALLTLEDNVGCPQRQIPSQSQLEKIIVLLRSLM